MKVLKMRSCSDQTESASEYRKQFLKTKRHCYSFENAMQSRKVMQSKSWRIALNRTIIDLEDANLNL